MTQRYGEPTRYLSFKFDKFAAYLGDDVRVVFAIILNEPKGTTFDELRYQTKLGPRHLKAALRHLFDKDYIITNYQIASLSEKLGIDVNKIRGYKL